jgi:putative transposase
MDNGQEFCANKVKKWARDNDVALLHIKAGSPWQNSVNESFNGRLRDECLSQEDFWSLAEAKVIIERFRNHYNAKRPHSSLGYKSPLEFANLQSAGLAV